MYEHDERIVMTLDAGGTNFVFSAIQGCREIVEPICLPAASDDLERCLSVLVEGFLEVEKRLPVRSVNSRNCSNCRYSSGGKESTSSSSINL